MVNQTRDVFGLVKAAAELKQAHLEQNKKLDELIAAVRYEVIPQIIAQLKGKTIQRGAKGDGVISQVWHEEGCVWCKFAGSSVEYLVCIQGMYDEEYFTGRVRSSGNTTAYNAWRGNRVLVLNEADLQLLLNKKKKGADDGTQEES